MITIENWGLISYSEAWERQTALFDELIDAKLNGKPYEKAWISHEDIMQGGVLELTMGNVPEKSFGVKKQELLYTKSEIQ